MAKSPKAFDRLYVNMIKAGEAGGALEVILRRLAEFQERSLSLKRKIKGAMVYPIVVVLVAVGILTFIMIKIVPTFIKIFDDFDVDLPAMTVHADQHLATLRSTTGGLIPGIPDQHLAVGQADPQVQGRPHGLGPVHCSRCRSSASSSKKTSSPAPPARWARWWPAACRFSKA